MYNTYKIKPDELTSLDKDPVITSTIKANPYKANVEIEGKERVLAPDMAALYLAKGKRHSKGGMEVYLPENSFIFSDDKDLAFDEDDHELFELKKGGNFKKANNTPSKVLKRNVDEKHYNSLIEKVSDAKSDDFTKRTAALMLNKYEESIGKVAFIQEGKKDYPTGVPDFAEGTAPVYEAKLKDKIEEQKQYMKEGGYKLPKADLGMDFYTDPYRRSKTPQGGITPTGKSSFYNRGPEYLQSWEQYIPGITNMDNRQAQSLIYDHMLKNDPTVIANMWKDAGLTNRGKKFQNLVGLTDKDSKGRPLYTFNNTDLTPDKLGQLKNAYTDGMFGYRQLEAPQKRPQLPTGPTLQVGFPEPPPPPFQQAPDPTYKPLEDTPNRRRPINWEFNKYQKQDMMFDGLQWASARQEFPYRSQVQSPLVDLERVNPQAALNQVDNAVNNSYMNSRALNPYLAAAGNQQAFGQSLDQKSQIQSQYDNQNVQIANQQNLANNQIQRGDQQFNVQADQQYWREGVEGRKNFDNLKDFAFNNFRNTRNRAIEQNQQLAYGLAAFGDYQPFDYDFKTGQYNLTGRASILDQNGNSKADFTQGLIERISKSSISEDKKLELLTKLGVSKQLTLPQQRRGGMMKNPYKC